MRTSYVTLKIGNMRKAQEFIIYPVLPTDNTFIIQSNKAIGRVNFEEGTIYLSKSRPNGGYATDLYEARGAKYVTPTAEQMTRIREAFNKMAGITATSGTGPNNRTITLIG